jgi:hypothetical protein
VRSINLFFSEATKVGAAETLWFSVGEAYIGEGDQKGKLEVVAVTVPTFISYSTLFNKDVKMVFLSVLIGIYIILADSSPLGAYDTV